MDYYKLFTFIFYLFFITGCSEIDNLSKIDQIKSPCLIISGLRDEVVPHLHSNLLFNKANNPKKSLFIDEAMHNNLYDFDVFLFPNST